MNFELSSPNIWSNFHHSSFFWQIVQIIHLFIAEITKIMRLIPSSSSSSPAQSRTVKGNIFLVCKVRVRCIKGSSRIDSQRCFRKLALNICRKNNDEWEQMVFIDFQLIVSFAWHFFFIIETYNFQQIAYLLKDQIWQIQVLICSFFFPLEWVETPPGVPDKWCSWTRLPHPHAVSWCNRDEDPWQVVYSQIASNFFSPEYCTKKKIYQCVKSLDC